MHDMDLERRQLLSSLVVTGMAAGGSGCSQATPPPIGDDAITDRIERFGAVGDGKTDDSSAFARALATIRPGGVLALSAGRTYRITRSLILQRPLVLTGGTKENTRLLFDDGAYATLGRQRAALILPHETSGMNGTSRRTQISGVTMEWMGKRTASVCGMLAAAPIYCYEVDIRSFPLDGFRVEANSPRIRGNANGSSFVNCSAQANGGNGFVFQGNDANACALIGARAFDNGGAGFLDASLMGNTYVAGEVDGNQRGGFVSEKTLPNRSIYIGCYAEPNQLYDLNNRNLLIAPLGECNGHAPSMLRALPSGEIFMRSGLVVADDEATALEQKGKSGHIRLSTAGIELTQGDGQRVRIAKLLSSNYIDILNGDVPVLRLPADKITENVDPARPWMPQGLTLGATGRSGILGAGDKPPSSGSFRQGALWLNDAPALGKFAGWICVVSGTPGTWHGFGRIE